MIKSFKILATILSVITLVSNLLPIKAMNPPLRESVSKCYSYQEKRREEVVKRLITYYSRISFFRYDFDILPKLITPEEIVSTTCEAQENMRDIGAQYFSKVRFMFPTYEKFASVIIAYNFLFLENLEGCKFLDYPGITPFKNAYPVPANGLLSHHSIIKILCIADPKMSKAFKSDRMTVIYKNNSLVINFYFEGKVVHESTLG